MPADARHWGVGRPVSPADATERPALSVGARHWGAGRPASPADATEHSALSAGAREHPALPAGARYRGAGRPALSAGGPDAPAARQADPAATAGRDECRGGRGPAGPAVPDAPDDPAAFRADALPAGAGRGARGERRDDPAATPGGRAAGTAGHPDRLVDPDRVPAAVVPAPATVPVGADQDAGAEDQPGRKGRGEGDARIIDRHIDALGRGRLDEDDRGAGLLANGHHLLRRGFQVADLLRLRPQRLDRVGDILRLLHEGRAEGLGPVQMVRHHLQHFGKARQPHHRLIPGLRVGAGEIVVLHGGFVGAQPAVGLHNLGRKGARRQDQRDQRIGIKRDRPEQIFEIGERIDLGRGLRAAGRRRGRKTRRRLRQDHVDAHRAREQRSERDPRYLAQPGLTWVS